MFISGLVFTTFTDPPSRPALLYLIPRNAFLTLVNQILFGSDILAPSKTHFCSFSLLSLVIEIYHVRQINRHFEYQQSPLSPPALPHSVCHSSVSRLPRER